MQYSFKTIFERFFFFMPYLLIGLLMLCKFSASKRPRLPFAAFFLNNPRCNLIIGESLYHIPPKSTADNANSNVSTDRKAQPRMKSSFPLSYDWNGKFLEDYAVYTQFLNTSKNKLRHKLWFVGNSGVTNCFHKLRSCQSDSSNLKGNPELNREATLQNLSDEEIWKMKVAIAQNATIGIDWLNAIKVLQTSSYHSVEPLTIAYNSALSAAERNCNADLSLEIINDMKKHGDKIVDAVSYKLAISACVKCNRLEDALMLYDEVNSCGYCADHGTIRNMLWLLSKHGNGGLAIKLLDRMKQFQSLSGSTGKMVTQSDYLNTIESCIKSQMYEESFDLYREMLSLEDFKMSQQVLSCILGLCHITCKTGVAMELYSKILKLKTIKLNLAHFKLILNMLLLNREFKLLELVWNNMINDKISIDFAAYQILLHCYALSGQFKKSFELLRKMENEGFLVNRFEPFISAVESCRQCGEWRLALKILRMAHEKNAGRSIDLYNSVLSVFANAEEWDAMIPLCEEIERNSKSVDFQSHLIQMDQQEQSVPIKLNGDTIAYAVMAYFHLGEIEKVKHLLSIPVMDTPLLMKLRSTANV